MGYIHIENLYRQQEILMFRECYALEKIHGTSAHITWNNQLHLSSGAASSVNFQKLFPTDLAEKLKAQLGLDPAVIYGEAYGGKLLGMSGTYGKNLGFIAFDVKINDLWLSVPQAEAFVKELGLDFVSYNKIPCTVEAIEAEIYKDSVLAEKNGNPGKIREGVVLRPLMELRKNNDQRFIVKHKRPEFRETEEIRSVEVDPAQLKVLEDARQVAFEWVTAQRLQHILDKIEQPHAIQQIKIVIANMLEDVHREGSGEFVPSKEVDKEIGRRASELFRSYMGFDKKQK